MEFSRDRKSMSAYCTPSNGSQYNLRSQNAKLFVKGAPESILERCTYVRIGKDTVELTADMRNEIIALVTAYGTGKPIQTCLSY